MTDTNTLAPCPFCGERAETDFIPEHHSYQVECSDSIGCTARITRDSELGAIEAWNCRAALAAPAQAMPAPGAQLEAVGTGGWLRNGALLYRLTDERRPANFDEIRVTMANGSRDIGQMSVQAERLLVMLTAPQPAAQAQEDVPDMFWDADDTENFAHEIQDIIDGYGPGEIVTIECAKRLPNLRVVVTRDGDGLSYEYLEAAIVAQEGGAHG